MIRSFVAIPLPEHVRDALEDIQIELDVGRLMAPHTFHITLAYLDKQTELTLERIHEVLSQVQIQRFSVQIRGLGLFGGRQPRVLWAGIETNDAMNSLREKARRAAMRSGVSLSRERFRPHVTLARFGNRIRGTEMHKIERFLTANADFEIPEFEISEFVLFRSTLHQTGAMHDRLMTYPLQN